MFKISKMITRISIPVLLIFAFNVATAEDAPKWNVDASHTTIDFSVKHFFTPVKGTFDDFNIDLRFDPNNLEGSSIDAEIMINSINTRNDKRDNHLMSGDFFNAEKFPKMTFTSDEIVKKGQGYVAKGTLQIKDVKKEVELPFQLLGVKELPEEMSKNFGGIKEVASFQASYTLDRNDYDVGTGSWAATVVVGDEVNITISLEANRK
ncbi:MAG: polyisoprenoid-binding protein [Caldithrix sp.]|nr:polyisoprenoid-binding protein [Caldithrix sp.]